MSASLVQLHSKARRAIEPGESKLREATEYLAQAQKLGGTQRQSAKAIGKSPTWVNKLLKWRDAGYKETPFGPQSKAKRAAAVKATKQPMTEARANAERAKAEAAKARAEAVARIFGPAIKTIPIGARTLLIKALRSLAADSAAERASAALIVENARARLNLTWDELIVPAESAELSNAA